MERWFLKWALGRRFRFLLRLSVGKRELMGDDKKYQKADVTPNAVSRLLWLLRVNAEEKLNRH